MNVLFKSYSEGGREIDKRLDNDCSNKKPLQTMFIRVFVTAAGFKPATS